MEEKCLEKTTTKENSKAIEITFIDDSTQIFNSKNYGWNMTDTWLEIYRKDGKMRLWIPISVVKQISVEEVP